MLLVPLGPGCPGEVTGAMGKGGTCSAAGAEASLTLFPAAASAISIYSPAASPPGHSAAAVAGFQGCSVIKHPRLLQLLHFASPAATGAGAAPGLTATPKGCSKGQWLKTAGDEDEDGSQPLLPLSCLIALGTEGVPDPLLYCWRKEQVSQTRPSLGLWGFCPLEGPFLLQCQTPAHGTLCLDRKFVGWWWPQAHQRANTLLWWLSWGTGTQEAEQHLFCPCAECGRAETFTLLF